jgi:hypothetical protein
MKIVDFMRKMVRAGAAQKWTGSATLDTVYRYAELQMSFGPLIKEHYTGSTAAYRYFEL